MAHRCADCGADAEIFDDEIPLCLLCSDVRDAKAKIHETEFLDKAQNAREEYRSAIAGLRTARELLGDLDLGHPDGTASLKHARARFSQAKDAYREATNALIERARELRGRGMR
jgi:outer membrane protein TolC